MPVGELLARTSSLELSQWQAYEQEYGPLGPDRGDWQTALLAHTIVTAAVGKKARKLGLADFLLRWGGGRKRQTASEQLSVLKAFAARQNARSKER